MCHRILIRTMSFRDTQFRCPLSPFTSEQRNFVCSCLPIPIAIVAAAASFLPATSFYLPSTDAMKRIPPLQLSEHHSSPSSLSLIPQTPLLSSASRRERAYLSLARSWRRGIGDRRSRSHSITSSSPFSSFYALRAQLCSR